MLLILNVVTFFFRIDYFKQLVVLHKVPKNFDITPYLDGFVESHDHKAFQEAERQKAQSGGG